MKSEKTDYSYLLMRAAKGARSILKDKNKLNTLVDTASVSIDSGVSQINSVKDYFKTLLGMLKASVKGDYSGVSKTTLLLSAGAVVYFINPLDAIPDILPATGLLDDATVIGIVITSVKKDIEEFRLWESGNNDEENELQPESLTA